MDAFFDAIASILAFFYSLWPSYGGAIILLTLSVMVVMTPLTLKGTRSMMAMQRLQPEMKRIQDRYKDDREKLNEELLKFYRENNISPVGGCLPLLLQLPVFIVLFRVLRGLTQRVSDLGVQFGWTTGQLGAGDDPTSAPDDVTVEPFDPSYLDQTSDLYQSLAGATEMNWLGIDLSSSASQAVSEGLVHALPYVVLIAIVAFSGWFQQKQTQARSQSEQTDQQKMIGRVMLFFLPAISFGLPAGIVLYFVVSNGYRIGQQYYITRTMYRDGDKIVGGDDKEGKAAKQAKVTQTTAREVTDSGSGGKGARSADKGGGKSGGKGARSADKGGGKSGGKGARSADKGGGKSGGKGVRSGGSRRTTPKKGSGKKTFTSDPRRKRGKSGGELVAQPRPRKKKRK